MLDRLAALQPDLLAQEALGDRQNEQAGREGAAVERTHALSRPCTSSERIDPIENWPVNRAGEPFVSCDVTKGYRVFLSQANLMRKHCFAGSI